MREADGGVRQVALQPHENTIGRGPENQIVIEAADASRAHAVITVEQAFVTIQDLGSRNGTFVNGHKVKDQVLAHGDVIVLGSYEMKFVVASQEFSKIEALELLNMHGLIVELPPRASPEHDTTPAPVAPPCRTRRS